MLVFVVAMVCIIHIPHLLESPAPRSSCQGRQTDTCQSPREAMEKRLQCVAAGGDYLLKQKHA